VGGFFHSGVAIATVHSKLIDVKRVIEGDGLSGLVTDACVFWGKIIGHPRNDAGDDHGQTHENFDRQPVGVAWENIGHGFLGKK
jgi:hypothetical protein